MVNGRLCAAAFVAAAMLVPTTGSGSDRVPALVRRAMAQYALEHRGDVAFSRHLTFTLHAGPLVHDVRNEIGLLMRNGQYVKVRYYSASTNGKPDDAADLQRQEARANADLDAGRGFFKEPIDQRFENDYRIEPVACESCPAGHDAFAFTSLVHDGQHGSGTLLIDAATAQVVRISYALERPPQHANSADGVETFGEALPGLWTCLHVEETYHGKLGLISGTATLSYTFHHFRRFSDLATGLSALSQRSL